MTHSMPFSSDHERWSEISNFPTYQVSSWGRVRNAETGTILTLTRNTHGLPIVGLMGYSEQKGKNIQHKRAVPLLVADAFVTPPSSPAFDTPTHIDGDRSNNHYTNLMWRPLWFSRKYMKQFWDDHVTCLDPIEDIETGERYKNSMDAAVSNGVLDVEIMLAMHNNTYVWPTGQVFRRAV